MLNHFKAIAGHLALRTRGHEAPPSTMRHDFFPFDDDDPAATARALARARAAFPDGVVSVYARRAGMPLDVPEIGFMAATGWLKPGEARPLSMAEMAVVAEAAE